MSILDIGVSRLYDVRAGGADGLSEFTLCLNAVSDPVTNNGSARIDYRNFYFIRW